MKDHQYLAALASEPKKAFWDRVSLFKARGLYWEILRGSNADMLVAGPKTQSSELFSFHLTGAFTKQGSDGNSG